MTMAEQMRSLTREFTRSYEARTAGITALRQTTRAELTAFGKARQAMARQQRGELARGRSSLRAGVSAQLTDLDRAHNSMAQRQRAELAEGRGELAHQTVERLKDVAAVRRVMGRKQRADLAKGEAQRKAQVTAWLGDLAAAHAGARAAWRDLVATMAAKRNGASARSTHAQTPAPPPARSAAPSAPRRQGAGPGAASQSGRYSADEEREEARLAANGTGAKARGPASLGNRLFAFLASHPDGARLRELEEEFRLPRFQAAGAVRDLIDGGKVEKRGLLYFAV